MTFYLCSFFNYEVFVYDLYQYTASFLFSGINTVNPFIFIILFCLGILTNFTPCFISLIPLSLAYVNNNRNINHTKYIFILGLITSFFCIFLITAFITYNLSYIKYLPLLSFFLLIIISLNLLEVIDLYSFILRLSIGNSIILFINKNIILSDYLMGFFIGFSLLPCSSSILIVINLYLLNFHKPFIYLSYLFFYLLGSILPFIFILSTFVNYLKIYFFSAMWNIIVYLFGFILLTLSLFSFMDKIILS